MSDDSKLVEAREKIVAKLLLSECHMEPSDRNRLAAEIVDALSAHPAGDVALRGALGSAYETLARIHQTNDCATTRHAALDECASIEIVLATPAAPTTDASGEDADPLGEGEEYGVTGEWWAAPTDAGALVEELEALFSFLRGEGELDGKWFGDTVAGTPPYWWRKHVRQLQPRLTALRASTGTPAEREDV